MGFRVTGNQLHLSMASSSLEGFHILHISDTHYTRHGERNSRLCHEIDEIRPDVLVVTGDVLDRFDLSADPFFELIEGLKNQYPVYFCFGNHELDVRNKHPEDFARFLDRTSTHHVQILDDTGIEISKDGGRFFLYGISTRGSGYEPDKESVKQRLGPCPTEAPAIVLAHDPAWFDVLGQWGANAILSGHIHGGIINLPFLGGVYASPFCLFPRYYAGRYEKNGSLLYVSRGLGGSPLEIRIRNPHELVVHTITREKPLVNRPQSALSTWLEQKKPVGGFPLRKIIGAALRAMALLILSILLLWSLLPLFVGITGIGVWATFFACALLIGMLLMHRRMQKSSVVVRRIWKIVCVGAIVFLVVFTAVSIWMMWAASGVPPPNKTMVVLGGPVKGTTVSPMLANRLDTAVLYLKENPQSPCVVTGGRGAGAHISEAQAMREYLVDKGINPARIIMEDRAKSTYQNMQNSSQIIREYGLDTQVVVVTDTFHQLRASLFARRAGLNSSAHSCSTVWYLLPYYWVREMFALAKAVVLGY